MEDIKDLCAQWMAVKEQEKEVMIWRRDLEDRITKRLQLEGTEKNTTKEMEGYKITATVRKTQSVDAQHVRELAAQHELQGHLGILFRWDAKVNNKVWAKADPQVTQALQQAITEKVSRPSFKIEEL